MLVQIDNINIVPIMSYNLSRSDGAVASVSVTYAGSILFGIVVISTGL